MAQNEAITDPKKVVVELTMTVEEARRVMWRGRGAREPIGKRLDEGTLDTSDLSWAMDTYKQDDPRLSEAARTLLAVRLGGLRIASQKPNARYGPQVIMGTNYLREKEEESFGLTMGLVGYGLGAAVVLFCTLTQSVLQMFTARGNSFHLLATGVGILLAGGAGIFIFREIQKQRNEYKSFRAGREGEDIVVDDLRSILDNRWTIFRNLVLPNRKDDVDLVLVGPGGIWAVQVKSSKTTLRAQGMKWEVNTKNGWKPAAMNPAQEVSDHAKRLNIYLQEQGIKRWVERAIALAHEQPISYFEQSAIPVWLPPTIEQQARNLSTQYLPTEQEIQKIVGILKQLNDRQVSKNK